MSVVRVGEDCNIDSLVFYVYLTRVILWNASNTGETQLYDGLILVISAKISPGNGMIYPLLS